MNRYSLSEASKKLGLGYQTLRRLVNENKVQHHRPSERVIFFTDEDLERFLDNCKVVPKVGGGV